MDKIRFNTYSINSKGLKSLKKELQNRGDNVLLVRHSRSRYVPSPSDLIVNWGIPKKYFDHPHQLNKNARNASNKLRAFNLMVRNGLRWTTDKEEAKTFKLCYAHINPYSSGGRGVRVVKPFEGEEVPDAPLYTKGIPNIAGEFRVHVFKGQVIDFAQKKKLRPEELEARGITHNPLIRNLEGGYIFAREGVELHPHVVQVSIEALEDLSLDFGAVDVVLSAYSDKGFVLEVNTAPGLQGSTIVKYANAIKENN